MKYVIILLLILVIVSIAKADDIVVYFEENADREFLLKSGFVEIEPTIFRCITDEVDRYGNVIGILTIYIIIGKVYA